MSEKQDGSNRVLSLSQEKFCADGKKQEGKVRLSVFCLVWIQNISGVQQYMYLDLKKKSMNISTLLNARLQWYNGNKQKIKVVLKMVMML